MNDVHFYSGKNVQINIDINKEEKWIRSTVPEEERLLARLNGMCSGVKWFLRKH